MFRKIMAWGGVIAGVALVVALNRGAMSLFKSSPPKPTVPQQSGASPGQHPGQLPRIQTGIPAVDRELAALDKSFDDCYTKKIKKACADLEAMQQEIENRNRQIDAMGKVWDARNKDQLDRNKSHQRDQAMRSWEHGIKMQGGYANERDRLIRQGDAAGAKAMEDQRKYHEQQVEQSKKTLNKN